MNGKKQLWKAIGNDNLRALKLRWRVAAPKTGPFLCLKNTICVQCRVAVRPRKPSEALGTLSAFFILKEVTS
ncbi:MAG: hypothetical protein CSA26_03440 [Desulfobacterales bacterium]|nr:MAG: hypothetical protein CSA26_03440 [Desulfobacterales bacterium]